MSTTVDHPDHFFKFTSANTAQTIITSKSFRWSTPLNFNDPFDHQAGFTLYVEPGTFAHLLTASIERVVFSDIEPTDQSDSLFPGLIRLIRPNRHKLNKGEFLNHMYVAALEVSNSLEEHFDRFNEAICRHLSNSRVFCVTEELNNVVMWSHYAEEHRGVAFKLRCINELDNALLAARKVEYSNKFAPFLSPETYANHLTGESRVDIPSLCWQIPFLKHSDWSYEKEWRVHSALLTDSRGDGYSVFPEDPKVFEAIYLGCKMSQETQNCIIRLVGTELPGTEVYRVIKSRREFALENQRIA